MEEYGRSTTKTGLIPFLAAAAAAAAAAFSSFLFHVWFFCLQRGGRFSICFSSVTNGHNTDFMAYQM